MLPDNTAPAEENIPADMTTTPAAEESTQAAAPAPANKPVAQATAKTMTKTATKTATKSSTKPVASKGKTSASKAVSAPAAEEKNVVKGKAKAVAKKDKEPVAKEVGKSRKEETKQPKLIRDSFTFPETDYALIAALKQRSLKAGHEIKKSELLRAGLVALQALSDESLLQALTKVERIKTGRPKK